ncbi:3D domain-containing protein [Gorillibacterium massiliense]|uniref:3D domain-containing protein n=1 Tax=Gorillibacterium massiliense TaxID=1280390 RepID=UPI002351E9FA|nr:3D domain-containing protein [Gorillibacterium massiliense]
MFAVFFKRTKWVQMAAIFIAAAVVSANWSSWLKGADEKPAIRQEAESQKAVIQEAQVVQVAQADRVGESQTLQQAKTAGAGERIEKSAGFFDFLVREHFRAENVVATGYYAGIDSTGKSPGHPEYGITYSGVKVRRGLFSTVAADPALFPIGTILYIPDYGFGVVADTGSAIKGRKIDLYFETKRQVYDQWGKREVRVSVLRRGNGRLSEAILNRLNERKAYLPSDNEVKKS